MISKLSSKDKINFVDFCLKRNKDLKIINYTFNNIIKRNGFCYVCENNNGEIIGVLFIDSKTKQLEMMADNFKIINSLLRVLVWNQKCDVFWTILKDYKFKYLLKKYKFFFVNDKDDKVVTMRRYFKRNT